MVKAGRCVLLGILVTSCAILPYSSTPVASAGPVTAQVCQGGVCDGQKDPSTARDPRLLQPVFQWSRRIELHVSYTDGGMAWADISNGSERDEVWLDRRINGVVEPSLGRTSIPGGWRSWRTQMYWISDPARGQGMVRACGKADDRAEVSCTAWLPECRSGWCDGADPDTAPGPKTLQLTGQWSRNIRLHLTYGVGGGMAWASIDNGGENDEVWLDRSWNNGSSWDGKLGDSFVPGGRRDWRTLMYSLAGGRVRACGKAGDRPEIACTAFLPVCNEGVCDGADPGSLTPRLSPVSWAWYREITLQIAPNGRTAWATIDNGDDNDQVWIDRSWNGGATWDGKLGSTLIPANVGGWRTWMFSFDDPATGRAGWLRACGQARDTGEIGCTPWTRPGDGVGNMDQAAVDILRLGHNGDTQKWGPDNGQWLSANALTATIDYMARSGDRRHVDLLNSILTKYPGGYPEGNGYYDDYAWWGLAWIRAYDLTGELRYLDAAEQIARGVEIGWNTKCGGGLRWQRGSEDKNIITNALYLKLAASLYNRGAGSEWVTRASGVWDWLKPGGGGNALLGPQPGLVKDTLKVENGQCTISNHSTYTYNQGVMAGALAELYRATGDVSQLDWATGIANVATTNSTMVSPSGVLHYDPEENTDGLKGDPGYRMPEDSAAFKGAFVRNLRQLRDVARSAGRSTAGWDNFLRTQKNALITQGRAGWAEFGFHWEGPIRMSFSLDCQNGWCRIPSYVTFATQASAVDAFNASSGL